MRNLSLIFLFLSLMLALSPSVWAQATHGAITGTVVDEGDARIPGATLTVTNQGTGQIFTRVSTDQGTFRFPSLIPGAYRLRAELDGFKTFVAENIKVNVGKEYTLLVTLQVGEITTEVVVAAGAELVEKTEAKVSTTITQEQILKLPLNGRNPISLMQLNAGVAGNGRTNTVISGNRTSYTSISLDGVNIQDNFIRSNSTDFVPVRPTTETVAEFTITTLNQGSEAGFGSNQVDLVTPSGSNDFHGSVYLFHRNSAAGANTFFNNRSGAPREFLIRNQFGVTASGPAIKDRLLFFFNYEGQRIRQSDSQNTTVPTTDIRNGIFTYNDTTDGTRRQVNILDLAGVPMDPFIGSFLALVPNTINNFEAGDSEPDVLRNSAGFRFNQAANNDRNQYKFRLDYVLNDSHSFEGVYQWLENSDLRDDIDGTFNQVPVVTSGTGGAFSDFFSTAWKWTVSPTLLNEVRFGAFLSPVLFQPGSGSEIASDEAVAAGFTLTSLPFTNPVEDFERQGRITNTWTVQDNASWQRGAHSLRFGFQSNLIRVNSFACFTCIPEYSSALSVMNPISLDGGAFPGGISASDLSSAEDWLAALGGILSTGAQEFNITSREDTAFAPVSDDFNWEYDTYALYFGDNWRLTPRFTLNLGLRWEYTPNLRESNGLIVQVVPQSGQHLAQALLDPNAVYDFINGDLIEPDNNNWAPNVGFAWDLFGDSRTTLRAGYGISYVNDEAIRSTDTWLNREGLNATGALQNLTSSISQGLPAIPMPEFELPLPLTTIAARDPGGKGTFGIPNDLIVPYVQTWNVSLARETPWDMAVEVRYVGSKGTRLRRGVDLNQVGTGIADFTSTGFLDDFLRARSNGFLAQAATGTFDARYNPNIPGSQELTIFPQLPGGGFLTAGVIRSRIQQGRLGDVAYIYIINNLTGGFPLNPNFNANFADLAFNQASSIYHGGQIDVKRRFTSGLVFNANYTFSKVFTDASGTGQTNFEPFVHIDNPGYERQRAAFDLTHNFNANFIFQLPFGRGRRFNIDNGFLNALLGGWEVTSIFQWQSGQPFGITSGRGTLNRDGRSGGNRADSTASVDQIRNLLGIVEVGGDIYYINPNGITGADGRAVAPDGQDPFAGQIFFHPQPGTLGNLPGTAWNGPQFFNWDFSVAKIFNVGNAGFTEDLDIEFRAEFFNFPNNHNFNPPSNWGINSTRFGQITGTTGSPRIIQFALKVLW